jgi:hypothetical protein
MLLLALALTAAVPDLDAARKAYVDVDYARCRDKSQAALLQPGSQKDRVEAWRLVGLCAAAQNDTDAAREAFRMMLAIDGDARLPEGLSPRFTSSFREAKGSWVGITPLRLSVASEEVGDALRTVRVKIDDQAELVARIAWRGPSGALSTPVKKAPQVELELPNGVDVVVVAFDKAQGEVAQLSLPAHKADTTSPLDPIEDGAGDGADGAEEEGEGSALPFIIAGGVVGAVVVVGAAAGVAVAVFSPPQRVNLKTDVTFSE